MKKTTVKVDDLVLDKIQPYIADAVTRTVRLEDLGQDTLWLKIDDNGIIQEAGPFQGWFWGGGAILNHKSLKVGGKIKIRFKHESAQSTKKTANFLRYRCVGLEAPRDGLAA